MKVKMKIALLKSLYDFWRVAVPAAVEKGKEGKKAKERILRKSGCQSQRKVDLVPQTLLR